MPGSSRSLIRALDSLFIGWTEPEENNPTQLSPSVLEVIQQFHEKHNTLAIIRQSTSINDELFRIYNTYIKPSSNLRKESLFLAILAQVSGVLNRKEVDLWLKTYLKPAVDSAGFDLGFVEKSRDFVRSLTTSSMIDQTTDPDLVSYRRDIESSVINKLLQIFIGNKQRRNEFLHLETLDEHPDSQVYQERIRFIKFNCTLLIDEYNTKKPKTSFEIIDNYVINAPDRLEILTLISALLSKPSENSQIVFKSTFFENLIRCLLYDMSESVLVVALTILTILIPQVTDDISKYISELFLILTRVSIWDQLNTQGSERQIAMRDYLRDSEENWSITEPDREHQFIEVTSGINFAHFGTILYGLFPFNLGRLTRGPLNYFDEFKTRFISKEYLSTVLKRFPEEVEDDPREKSLEKIAIEKLKSLFRGFRIHPKYIESDEKDLSKELEFPSDWIKENQVVWSNKSEEIAVACYNLNPDLMVDISETMLLSNSPKSLYTDNSTTSSSQGLANRSISNTSLINANHISRNSSFGSPVYFHVKDSISSKFLLQHPIQNLNRKLSIVPTNLVVESHPNQISSLGSEIKFKEVKFNEGVNQAEGRDTVPESDSKGPPSSPELSQTSSNEPINELFATHEALYGPHHRGSLTKTIPEDATIDFSSKRSASSFLNEKGKNELLFQKHISSPTTSLETTPIHKGSIISSGGSTLNAESITGVNSDLRNKASGTSLDFYQRELLLIKNELEFSSYMKHLNKFRFLKLKLEYNQFLRESNYSKRTDLKDQNHALNESLEFLKVQLLEQSKLSGESRNEFILKLELIRKENDVLGSELEILKSEKLVLSKELHSLARDVIPEKNFELGQLKIKLEEFEKEIALLKDQVAESGKSATTSTSEESQNSDLQLVSRLSSDEEKIYNLNIENSLYKEKNEKLVAELNKTQEMYEGIIKNHESKIAASKMDVNENLHSFTLQYEKKIQELSTTILKYEALLEEKNGRLVQLMASKAISIPGTPDNMGRTHSGGKIPLRSSIGDLHEAYDGNKTRSNSSLDSTRASPQQIIQPHIVGSYQQTHNVGSYQPQQSFSHQQQVSSGFGGIMPHNPTAQSTGRNTPISPPPNTQQHPIIKGRGGYQKRSKKIM